MHVRALERDHEWLGRLSMTCALSQRRILENPQRAREMLRSAVREFMASATPSEELRQMLREEMR